MKKKLIIASTLSLFLCFGTVATASASVQETQQTEAEASQTQAQSQDVIREEAGPVQESEIARTMTRAEKAENARINDSWGGGITIISMSVVILALIVLSILFLIFGKISAATMTKKKRAAQGVTKSDALEHHNEVDSGDTIAAIAAALDQHFSTDGHDMEDTILTIRRMKRAYSPWNSKIYSMREVPSFTHHRKNL